MSVITVYNKQFYTELRRARVQFLLSFRQKKKGISLDDDDDADLLKYFAHEPITVCALIIIYDLTTSRSLINRW